MRRPRAIALAALLLAPGLAAAAPAETILYSFGGSEADGARPHGGLVLGPDGRLYGTTSEGGASDCSCGTVFVLTPPATAGGAWTETVLHSFQGYPADGAAPQGSLVLDAAGNLYGTTLLGGRQQFGTVFRLDRPAAGETAWRVTVLHDFAGPPDDGLFPYDDLLLDRAGALTGTASLGGGANRGILFRLAPPPAGGSAWTLAGLHSFQGGGDGAQPFSGVVRDGRGNLYGTTGAEGTGATGGSTAFMLAPAGTETVLHRFSGNTDGVFGPIDGGAPFGDLALDAAGNLYGTTVIGGAGTVIGNAESSNAGTVFRLTPPAAGGRSWRETLIHSFNGTNSVPQDTDGASPMGGILLDAAGNLYGTTEQGGPQDGGTLYVLSPPAGGTGHWHQTVLHSFTGSFAARPDGFNPRGNLARDAQGNLYGVTEFGTTVPNAREVGTVFEVALSPPGP